MNNSSAVITTTGSYVSRLSASTASCAAVAAAVGWWIYGQVITNPLHVFYRKGALGLGWANIPQADICAGMMGNKPEFPPALYDSCDYMREQCRQMIDREFESKDATIMVALYFTVLTFGIMQLMCNCCFIRPLVRAFRDIPRPVYADAADDHTVRRRSESCTAMQRQAQAQRLGESPRAARDCASDDDQT